MRKSILSKAAALMGRVKSEKKAAAARRNGKLGGAPKKKVVDKRNPTMG